MSLPKSTTPLLPPLALPAEKVTQGDIPLGLMQTSLRFRLSRMPHGRHIKEESKEIRIKNLASPRVVYSAPEVHGLVAQSWYPRR